MQNDNLDESGFTFFTPVPSEQIPVNEYRSLQERKFFRWAILERWKYTTKLLALWIAGFLFSMLFFTTRTSYSFALSDCLWSIIIADVLVLLGLLRLYTAWHNIYSRLKDGYYTKFACQNPLISNCLSSLAPQHLRSSAY